MLKNVSILGIGRTVAIGLAFAQSVVVARILGPESFGAVALVIAYPSLIFGILNVRTSETTTRFLAVYDAQGIRSRALGLCKVAYDLDLTVAGVAFAIVALTATWVAPIFLDDDQLIPLTTVYALSFVPAALGPTSVSIFSVTGRFLLTGGLEIMGATLRTGLVIGLVVAGLGIPGVVYGMVVANAILGVFTVLTAHRVVVRRWGASWLRSGWRQLVGQQREIARFFVLSDLTALFGVAIKNADVLILSIFRSTTEIGYYSLGKSIVRQLLSLVSAVRCVSPGHAPVVAGRMARHVAVRPLAHVDDQRPRHRRRRPLDARDRAGDRTRIRPAVRAGHVGDTPPSAASRFGPALPLDRHGVHGLGRHPRAPRGARGGRDPGDDDHRPLRPALGHHRRSGRPPVPASTFASGHGDVGVRSQGDAGAGGSRPPQDASRARRDVARARRHVKGEACTCCS